MGKLRCDLGQKKHCRTFGTAWAVTNARRPCSARTMLRPQSGLHNVRAVFQRRSVEEALRLTGSRIHAGVVKHSRSLTDQKPAGPPSCQYQSTPGPCTWATIANSDTLRPGMRNEIYHFTRTIVLLARLTFLVALNFGASSDFRTTGGQSLRSGG